MPVQATKGYSLSCRARVQLLRVGVTQLGVVLWGWGGGSVRGEGGLSIGGWLGGLRVVGVVSGFHSFRP